MSPENKNRPRRCTCARCVSHDEGRRGPFTPAEFAEIVGVVNEPPPVEMSYELALLGAEVDLAAMRVDRALENWHATVVARAKLGASAPDGAVSAAETAERDARELWDDEGARLVAARLAYAERAAFESRQAAAIERAGAPLPPADQRRASRIERMRAKVFSE